MGMTWVSAVALCSYACCVLLVLFVNQRKRQSGSAALDQRLFSWLLLATMAILVLEAITYAINGRVFRGARAIYMVVEMSLYAFQPVPALLYLCYCNVKLGYRAEKIKKLLPLYLLFPSLQMILVLLTPITPIFFLLNEQNEYMRGPYFIFSFLFSYMPILIAVKQVLSAAREKKRSRDMNTLYAYGDDYKTLLFFPIPPLIGGVCQFFIMGLSLIWPCAVLSLVTINANIQNRETMTDALTGLYNRRRTDQYLQRRFQDASENKQLSIAIMDIDAFKQINDQCGHSSGDEALKITANILRKTCGHDDFIGRFGGDEFLIISSCSRSELSAAMEKINTNLDAYCTEHRLKYHLSLSAGVAQWSRGQASTDAFLSEADAALYRQKGDKLRRRVTDKYDKNED